MYACLWVFMYYTVYMCMYVFQSFFPNIFLLCKVRCFECKKLGSAEEDGMFKCSYKRCKKFYHHQCTASWIGDPQCRVCPQHRCNACGSKKNSGEWKLFRCLDCPMAYHENCCPDGSLLLEDIPGYMICGKHENAWKKPTVSSKFRLIFLYYDDTYIKEKS